MENSWFFASGGVRKGPVALAALRDALEQGDIDGKSLVWSEGMSEWRALESVSALQSLLRPASTGTQNPRSTPPPLPPPLPGQMNRAPGPPPPSPQKREKTGLTREPGGVQDWLGALVATIMLIGPLSTRLMNYYLVVTVIYLSICLKTGDCWKIGPPPPPPIETEETTAATGRIQIDANPWGQVEWIRGTDGTRVNLPADRTTPFLMELPVGQYEARVSYPHTQSSDRCALPVQEDQVTHCWLALAPVEAQDYFEKIGW